MRSMPLTTSSIAKVLSKPKEHQHDFGGVFGGPIKRDRIFVFVSYEGLRLDQPKSAVTEVPSQASRLAASDALKPIFAAFPVPNGPDTARGLAQFSASYADPSTLDAASVRVDQTFGAAPHRVRALQLRSVRSLQPTGKFRPLPAPTQSARCKTGFIRSRPARPGSSIRR